MHRMLVLYPPPTDPEHFRTYYEGTHMPLADALPGLRNRAFGFDLATPDGSPSPYFASFSGDFDDEAAFGAAMGSPEGQAAGADLANFATGGAVLLHFDIDVS